MRFETKTVRIGERLGPIDWEGFDWDEESPIHHANIEAGRQCLKSIEATLDGESLPHCRIRMVNGMYAWKVVWVGMYDGWPFWRPFPTVAYIGPLDSVEYTPYYNLREVLP